MTTSQNRDEYLRAQAALLRLREVRTPAAQTLAEPLYEALGDPNGERFASMVMLTREAEAILNAR